MVLTFFPSTDKYEARRQWSKGNHENTKSTQMMQSGARLLVQNCKPFASYLLVLAYLVRPFFVV
jgi:hypothetical protein